MTVLTLGTLVPFRASLGQSLLTDFRTRKVQALLIYLVTEPRPQRRDLLMSLLWPGMPERSARSNLRQVLYYLRQVLPEVSSGDGDYDVAFVIANRQHIQLNPGAGIDVDTQQLEALLARAHSHEHLDLSLCQECAQHLAEAVTLYRGDFLADFYLDDSSEYEEWAQARREYYRRQVLDALAILATMALRRRDYGAAERYAAQQVDIDNLRESGYRQLMEALALSGRREQALAAYDSCRRVLAEELGMAPAARTTEHYDKIRAGDLQFDRLPARGVRGYELKEPLDEGAYGMLYRAVQPAIMREVAVKVIRPQYADNPEFIRRFEAEAQTVARLEHPHIVPLYDYWRDPEGAYLVMRYMRGGSLLAALKAGPWSAGRAAALLEQVAGSLAYAHHHGVVHRDIKPSNILLDGAGNAYLADFGIARELKRGEQAATEATVASTLDYASPEQILGEPVTPQTDIYSLGAVLYEILTGEKPFGDATVPRLLYSQLNEPIPLVAASRPDISAEVDAVLQKATAKQPAARYATPLEMAIAFRSAVDGAGHVQEIRWREELVAPLEVNNPYKGLQAFQESDAAHFFGREALVQQLVARLGQTANGQDGRFLAVVGPSGSGKSSVVKAGLIPALRDGALPSSDKWFVTEMVPGTDPFQELELALWRVAVDPPPDLVTPMQRDRSGILRTLRRILPSEPGPQEGRPQLLLVIDQFEELFTLVDDEDRRALFLDSLLAALAAPNSPLRLVITLRADFYDRPLQQHEWGQLLKKNTEVVLPLNSTELTWAVREPARTMGVRLEEGLESTIIAAVVDRPGALPLLQYALTELFERREGNLITRAAYEKLGGVHGALGRRAETLFAALDEVGQETARQLFLRLVTLGEGSEDTRRRVLRAELEGLDRIVTPNHGARATVADVLTRFGAARFLTFDHDPLTRAPTVEVAHEALLREWPRLRDWLAESRDDLRLQRLLAQAAGEWQAAGRDPGYLLRHARPDQFAGWAASTSVALTEGERAFVAASVAARERRLAAEEERRQRELQAARDLAEAQQKRAEEQASAAQRLRRRALYLAGALVVAAILAVFALGASRRASANAAAA
jgi:DNA-binding SARP family transcriptional activator/tRNA A-37 threonylcarbamoyl transferase component Bud32